MQYVNLRLNLWTPKFHNQQPQRSENNLGFQAGETHGKMYCLFMNGDQSEKRPCNNIYIHIYVLIQNQIHQILSQTGHEWMSQMRTTAWWCSPNTKGCACGWNPTMDGRRELHSRRKFPGRMNGKATKSLPSLPPFQDHREEDLRFCSEISQNQPCL